MVADVNLLAPEIRLRHAPRKDPRERRRHPRYPVSLPVLVAIGDLVERTCTRDVSISGMSLEADCPVPIGTKLDLLFEIPGDRSIHNLHATVRWVDPGNAVGVQFDAPRAWTVYSLLRFFRTL